MFNPPVTCQAVGDRIRVAITRRDGTLATATINPAEARALLAELNDSITAASAASRRKALEAAGQQGLAL